MKFTSPSLSIKRLSVGTTPRFYSRRVIDNLEKHHPKLHVVLSSEPVDIGCLPPPHPTLSSEFMAVLCEQATTDDLSVPELELLVQFDPLLIHSGNLLHPSVIYWRDEYWVPVLDLGLESEVLSAVLYRVEVTDTPRFDILATFGKDI